MFAADFNTDERVTEGYLMNTINLGNARVAGWRTLGSNERFIPGQSIQCSKAQICRRAGRGSGKPRLHRRPAQHSISIPLWTGHNPASGLRDRNRTAQLLRSSTARKL